MIDVYITHFVTRETSDLNDLLVDQLFKMRDTTKRARIRVVIWTDDGSCVDDARKRAPDGVEIFVNDRPGRPDSQPSMRNKVVDLARESGCEAFVLLHNDVRPARGWLDLLVEDWRNAERRWGLSSSVVSPRLVYYHLEDPHPQSGVRADTELWTKKLPSGRDVLTTPEIARWCDKQPMADVRFSRGEVRCPKKSRLGYDGRELMMFVAGSRFFDAVGECDEAMTGVNYDDTDWGIRAYQAGKRNLQSLGSLVGHVGGLTFNEVTTVDSRPRADNAQVFVAKWGLGIWDEMHVGQLWTRLQQQQRLGL